MPNDLIRVAVVGAGETGTPLLRKLLGAPFVELLGVADLDPEAPGMRLAEHRNVKTTTDFHDLAELGERLDVLIDVTGVPSVRDSLRKAMQETGNHHTVIVHEMVVQLMLSLLNARHPGLLRHSVEAWAAFAASPNCLMMGCEGVCDDARPCQERRSMELGILVIAAFVLVVILAITSVRTVPQGFNFIVERLGRYQETLHPGFNVIFPVISSIRAKVDMRETVVDVPSQSVITKDNAAVTADGVLYFQVLDPMKATYEVNDLQRAIQTLAMTTTRTVMGSMDLDELLSQREAINANLLRAVDEATASWGVRVTRIELRDITPPDDIVQAMGRQLKAERLRRAQILEADAEKESQIRIAQGKLEAAKLEAEARERLAEAEAKATRLVSEAVAQGSNQALGYFLGQKYMEALKAFAASPNQKTMILPVELAGVAGALSGLGELLRDATPPRTPEPATTATRNPWSVPPTTSATDGE
ncbi:hypothetical protein Lal_00005165 [Lupinus albus]|nr:hypothetical protein Lal_00005165 [Lupinus albus]